MVPEQLCIGILGPKCVNALRGGLQNHDATSVARFVHLRGALVRTRPDRLPERHLYVRFQERESSVFRVLGVMKMKKCVIKSSIYLPLRD